MVAALALVLATQSQSPKGILSFEEYHAAGPHKRPYVLHLKHPSGGEMIYFGIGHTNRPEDPQLATLRRMFLEFKPTSARNESQPPAPRKTIEESVHASGESGFLRWLCDGHKIPLASLDVDRMTEVKELNKTFTVEDLKLFFILRQVAQDRRRPEAQRMASVEEFVNRALLRAAMMPGLGEGPKTFAEFEETYRRRLGDRFPLRDVPDRWFNPGIEREPVFLNRIARQSSEYRDRYTVDLLLNDLKEGRRVFALVGASHVFMQRRAFEESLGKENVTLLEG